uniref:GCK domain-containing protein n=1 Tax=Odontella aurita TaxID=265563 RepID=A0A7S4J7E2_9STRA|mmetsp:Transcript_40443/g.121858  ORF Transcript_40443/g.121858 Transcript_40443/m.121858 type:complete len:181 (+) Transcript_40443:27-569(+)
MGRSLCARWPWRRSAQLVEYAIKNFPSSSLSNPTTAVISTGRCGVPFQRCSGVGRDGPIYAGASADFTVALAFLMLSWPGVSAETFSESSNDENSTAGAGGAHSDDNDDDDEINRMDEECPFCRFFLRSPCRGQFRQWHKCVEAAAKPTDCMEPFQPLKECMEEHGMVMFEGNDGSEGAD